jgi:hypothetical protein
MALYVYNLLKRALSSSWESKMPKLMRQVAVPDKSSCTLVLMLHSSPQWKVWGSCIMGCHALEELGNSKRYLPSAVRKG